MTPVHQSLDAEAVDTTKRCAYIFIFGDVQIGGRLIPASEIFNGLGAKGVWYLTHRTDRLQPGDHVLFYQNRVGIRGEALVASASSISDSKEVRAMFGPANYFTWEVPLLKFTRYKQPVSLAPLVARLQFIGNKKYWGQALRRSPRQITLADYALISSLAKK